EHKGTFTDTTGAGAGGPADKGAAAPPAPAPAPAPAGGGKGGGPGPKPAKGAKGGGKGGGKPGEGKKGDKPEGAPAAGKGPKAKPTKGKKDKDKKDDQEEKDKKDKGKADKDKKKGANWDNGLKAVAALAKHSREKPITQEALEKSLASIRRKYGFSELKPVIEGNEWDVVAAMSPDEKIEEDGKLTGGGGEQKYDARLYQLKKDDVLFVGKKRNTQFIVSRVVTDEASAPPQMRKAVPYIEGTFPAKGKAAAAKAILWFAEFEKTYGFEGALRSGEVGDRGEQAIRAYLPTKGYTILSDGPTRVDL